MKIFVLGADGYIATGLIQRLLNKGHKIIGFDDFWRRQWIKDDMNSISAIPIMDMLEKEKKFKEIGDFEFYELNITLSYNSLFDEYIKKYKPDVIVNLAHNPSAPFSMKSKINANEVLSNNIIGTNNVLWSIKKHCSECHYICLGTAGEYDHYGNIDIEEGYITFNHNGRQSNEMIFPRRPGSIYHCSKTASTYIVDYLSRTWNLKCTDVMQGIVFGSYTDDIDKSGIFSRLDFDEAGGTSINRFCVQAILGIPLTIYGEGKHQRSFLSLNDSIQALELLINNDDFEKGRVRAVNQLSEWHSMNDIANMVIEVGKKLGINVTSQHIDTPRNEHTGEHYYNFITNKLNELGYKPTRTIKEEVEYCLNILIGLEDRLEPYRNVVIPKINFKEVK